MKSTRFVKKFWREKNENILQFTVSERKTNKNRNVKQILNVCDLGKCEGFIQLNIIIKYKGGKEKEELREFMKKKVQNLEKILCLSTKHH